MPVSLSPVTRALSRWDARPLPSLLLRLGASALVLRLWSIRFLPDPLRLEDLDPSLLALARQQGISLADPGAWPHASTHVASLVGFAVALTLIWWGHSRLRHWMAHRLGSGALGLLLVGIAAIPLAWAGSIGAAALRHGNDLWNGLGGPGGAPVFGGWIQSPLFGYRGQMLAAQLALIAALTECLLLAFQGRLALAEARESALRSRLMPHFLFNALNTVHAQIESDPEGAQETTERLAGLFREFMDATEQPRVPLGRELAAVENLLGIERRRLGQRLQVEVDMPEETLDALIPVLGLQVLVDNAIRHAIEPRAEGGKIRIEARRSGSQVRVAVTDSGDGQSRQAQGAGTGRALANLRARLDRPRDLSLGPVPEGFQAAFTVRMA